MNLSGVFGGGFGIRITLFAVFLMQIPGQNLWV
jgi:hypothetical protein